MIHDNGDRRITFTASRSKRGYDAIHVLITHAGSPVDSPGSPVFIDMRRAEQDSTGDPVRVDPGGNPSDGVR